MTFQGNTVRGNAKSNDRANARGRLAAVRTVPGTWVRMALAGCMVAVCAFGATPALGITIDGSVSPADEWDAAEIHITDPNPEPPIPLAYDVTDIYLAGGTKLNFRLDVLDPPVVFGRFVYLRYDFAIDEDPGAGYSLSMNDGLGFPPTEMHLVRFPDWSNLDPATAQDLGQGTYAIGDTLEASFGWSLFPSDVQDAMQITLNEYYFVLETGPCTVDDVGGGQLSGPPLPMVPEPITLVGFLLGCGVLARRLASLGDLEG